MEEKAVCFTGHRKIPDDKIRSLSRKLKKVIIHSIKNGYCYFYTGGALGFDTLAAQTILKLKKSYKNIQLILVLPCIDQTKYWSPDDVKEYERIKSLADKVIYTSQEYSRSCMYKRNRYLIDNSSLCICYLNSEKSGTGYTVNYAKEQGLNVININNK